MDKLAITIILILMPGIIATIISEKLTHHSKWDSFKFSLYSLVLGILSYSILQVTYYVKDLITYLITSKISWTNLNIWNCALDNNIPILPLEIILASIVSLLVGFLVTWAINSQKLNKIATKMKISFKYGDNNLYSYYLNNLDLDWVYVRDLERNLTFQGRILSFSENDTIQEIVLDNVTVFQYEDSKELYSVPTLYFSRELGKIIIEEIPKENLGEENE